MILISACLCGVNCKYNGQNNLNDEIKKIAKEEEAILICPEEIFLSTPREPVEIVGGDAKKVLEGRAKVMSATGKDYTEAFIRSAYEVFNVAKKNGVKKAILKAKSPSCGFGQVYDGNFDGTLIVGNGVTAELLSRNGIIVCNENDFKDIL
ncbi:DUF523 domain-containing protein [Inconstantimicrobium mannanitabidum]|uniref:Uncharacterized protein n=1 Tax=Inconstantimicrobium mannanitabidum TaxID=1604901 RepID=A0ACB5RAF4_9CLOT|nr:DUF523 domain-containing protein [Clostridium sp. TW13]GKX66100.1 hypothetical protein rsdtw13_13580 [Clostridium sp. TW13]